MIIENLETVKNKIKEAQSCVEDLNTRECRDLKEKISRCLGEALDNLKEVIT